MSAWRSVRLEELAADERSAISKPYGSAMVKDDYRLRGIPVVRGVNLAQGIFHDDDFVFISPGLADKMPGAQLTSGDLVVTHRGTVGQVSMIPREPRYERYVPSTSQVKVRLDPARGVPEFFYYWFCSPLGRRTILEHVSTVGVPGLVQPVATVKRLMVPNPPLQEQRAIAEVLGTLDDKIAANTKLIALLDAHMALEYTAAVDSGTREAQLSTVAEFHNRRRVPLSARERELRPGTVPYYGASGVFGSVNEAIFHEPLVLVGEDGSVINTDGTPVVQYIWGPAWVNNHAHVLTGVGVSTEVLYLAIARAQVATLVTGAVQPKINMGNLKQLVLELPARNVDRLETIVGAETASKRRAVAATRTLTATRDALLPPLMSGKLRVKDAEKVLEDAGV